MEESYILPSLEKFRRPQPVNECGSDSTLQSDHDSDIMSHKLLVVPRRQNWGVITLLQLESERQMAVTLHSPIQNQKLKSHLDPVATRDSD